MRLSSLSFCSALISRKQPTLSFFLRCLLVTISLSAPTQALTLLNWPDYMDAQLLAEFKQKTGIEVTEVLFNSETELDSLACLFFDLNDFKPINDKYGHKVGDEVLIEVAKRIQREAREVDCAARIGGDEFIVILTELDSDDAVNISIQRFMEVISSPMKVSIGEITLSSSVGSAIYPKDAQNIDELITKADEKMYQHKNIEKH